MKIFELGGARVGLSDRLDGNMRVIDDATGSGEDNRRQFLFGMGLGVDSTYFVKLDYCTDDFCQFETADGDNLLSLGGRARRCDGLLTRESGAGLFLPLADCRA
jgi:hypothetical protein